MPELIKTILKNSANLKAYYRFESGALTTDSSGNSHTLTNNGTITDGTGIFGGGADLEASGSQYFSIADHADFNPAGDFSIGTWVKLETISTFQMLAHKGDGSTAAGSFLDFYIDGSNNVVFTYYVGASPATITAGGHVTSTGVWYHIVGVRSGSTSRLYVNGKHVGTASLAGTANNEANPFLIGKINAGAGYLDGILDDFFFFNGTALSADQIKELYEGRYLGELRPNQFGTTVGLWHLNGNSTDFSGNNNHGTDTAITYSQANGKFGQGASFNGSSSRITKATNLGITSTTPVTMSMWVNLNAEIGSGIWCFAELMNAAASGTSQKIYYEYNSGTRRLTFSRQGSAAVTASYTIALGTTNWYHLAYVWTGGVFTGYLNGNPVATGNENGSATFTGYSAQFNLGVLNTVDNTWFANTKIDEVMVSSTALTANQIRQIYALGVGKYY